MYFQTPTTLNEAVNVLLQSIGQGPISVVPSSGLELPNIAKNTILNTSRAVQATELWCNTEINYPLQRQTDGRIKVPTNTLDVVIEATSVSAYTVRGGYVYDRLLHTDVFEEGLVASKIVLLLSFEDLPQYVRDFIVAKAGREFQIGRNPTTIGYKFTLEQAQEAWAVLCTKENERTPTNLLQATDVHNIAHEYRRN